MFTNTTDFTQLGFSEAEIKCLLFLSRTKKASLKRISRETDIPENLAKIMLTKLKEKTLVCVNQNDYQFCGIPYLLKYLETQKKDLNNIYDQAISELKDFFEKE